MRVSRAHRAGQIRLIAGVGIVVVALAVGAAFAAGWLGRAPTNPVGAGATSTSGSGGAGSTAAGTGATSPSPAQSSVPGSTASGTPGGQAGPPGINCLARADRCGWPTANNTGVPAGTRLTVVNSDLHMKVAGRVYDALDIRGCVYIEASNTTLRRSKVNGRGCPYYVINNEVTSTARTNILIEDVDVDMTGQFNTKGVSSSNFTVRRVHFHGGADCVHYADNVVIEDSLCEVAVLPANSPAHADGFQSSGGRNVTIRHNTILNPNSQTSAIINGTDTSVLKPQYDVRIIGNLMAGGGWTVYCNAHYATTIPTIEFRGNRIARSFYTWPGIPARGGYYGPLTDCDKVAAVGGNVWDEDGSAIPLA